MNGAADANDTLSLLESSHTFPCLLQDLVVSEQALQLLSGRRYRLSAPCVLLSPHFLFCLLLSALCCIIFELRNVTNEPMYFF
jgi:hypothetical protein